MTSGSGALTALLRAAVLVAVSALPPAVGYAQTPAYARVLQIGEEMGAREYTFGLVSDVTFGPDDTIYVLDAAFCEVRVFDATGRFLRSFGRSGSGPGEFRFPTVLIVDSMVRVMDPMQQREVTFTLAGDHVDTRTVGGSGVHSVVFPLRHGAWVGGSPNTTSLSTRLVQLANEPTAVVRRLGQQARATTFRTVALHHPALPDIDTIYRYDHGFIIGITVGASTLSRSWGSGGAWTVSGDSLIALIDGFEGHVRVLRITERGVDTVRAGRVPITPQPLTERDWNAVEQSWMRGGDGRRPSRHLIGPPYRAQVGEPIFADDGTLWLQRLQWDPTREQPVQAPVTYLRMPLDGRAQSTTQLPAGFALKAVRRGLLLGTRRTELGVDLIEILRPIE